MTGRSEVADMIERKNVAVLCLQETKPKGSKARNIGGGCKLFYNCADGRKNFGRYASERKGMKVSRSKTEYLCVNGGYDEETVKMEDKKLPRVKDFIFIFISIFILLTRRKATEALCIE